MPLLEVTWQGNYQDARLHPASFPSSASCLNLRWDTPSFLITPRVLPVNLQIFLISLPCVGAAGTATLNDRGRILLCDRAFRVPLSNSNSFQMILFFKSLITLFFMGYFTLRAEGLEPSAD